MKSLVKIGQKVRVLNRINDKFSGKEGDILLVKYTIDNRNDAYEKSEMLEEPDEFLVEDSNCNLFFGYIDDEDFELVEDDESVYQEPQ